VQYIIRKSVLPYGESKKQNLTEIYFQSSYLPCWGIFQLIRFQLYTFLKPFYVCIIGAGFSHRIPRTYMTKLFIPLYVGKIFFNKYPRIPDVSTSGNRILKWSQFHFIVIPISTNRYRASISSLNLTASTWIPYWVTSNELSFKPSRHDFFTHFHL